MKRYTIIVACWLFGSVCAKAQGDVGDFMFLSVDSCRSLAAASNKNVAAAKEEVAAAAWEHKAALSKFFPRVSASGMYMRTSRQVSLLSEEQKAELSDGDLLGGMGRVLVDALHTDTRDMTGIGVMLTQPVFLGGKIEAYNNITRFAEQIAVQKRNLSLQNVIVEVDETYWNIVLMMERKRLAGSYKALVDTLDSHLEKMCAEGMATRADELSVRVKSGEADVSIVQLDNGIDLMKMRLCHLCGLELDTELVLTDSLPLAEGGWQTDDGVADRPELNSLSLAAQMGRERVRAVRGDYLPSVALMGGYMASNPSVFNSFERSIKGMWAVGVAVNVPLVTSGERVFKVNAAKAQAVVARLRWEDMKETVSLQVRQCRRRMAEAREKLDVALSLQASADENLRHADLGFREGTIPVNNLMEAQTAWLSAHLQVVDARIEMHLADIYLRKALGRMDCSAYMSDAGF